MHLLFRVGAAVAMLALASSTVLHLHNTPTDKGPLHQIASHIKPGDVLVVDGADFQEGVRAQIVVPLRYAFNLPTFILPPGAIDTRLPVFDRLRAVTRGSIYFLKYAHRDPEMWKQNGFARVALVYLGESTMRAGLDPLRLDYWILPYKSVDDFAGPLALYKITDGR
jgi:hypothetical protein